MRQAKGRLLAGMALGACMALAPGLPGADGALAQDVPAAPAQLPRAAVAPASLQTWGQSIRTKIMRHQRYPIDLLKAAKASGAAPPEGSSTVRFTVRRDGKLADASVETGSGLEPFDAAALRSVRAASPFARMPRGVKGETHVFRIVFAFKAPPPDQADPMGEAGQ